MTMKPKVEIPADDGFVDLVYEDQDDRGPGGLEFKVSYAGHSTDK
jgi:hypothetical protein